MTSNGSFERTLERWLADEAAVPPPDGLHDEAMARAQQYHPRARWQVALRGDSFGSAQGIERPFGRVGLLVAVIALFMATLLVALATGALQSTRTPALQAPSFLRPFDYVIPARSMLERAVESTRLYAFTAGSDEIYPRDPDGAFLPGAHGIAIAVSDGAVTHACPAANGEGRVPLRSEPHAFLDDLSTLAGVGLADRVPTTIDGRAGVTADLKPSREGCEFADFHVPGGGLDSGYVLMNIPARLWLVEVDGSTVVIQAWAANDQDLATWLPVATEFVDSLHFLPPR